MPHAQRVFYAWVDVPHCPQAFHAWSMGHISPHMRRTRKKTVLSVLFHSYVVLMAKGMFIGLLVNLAFTNSLGTVLMALKA